MIAKDKLQETFDDFLLSLQNINVHHNFIKQRETALLQRFQKIQDTDENFFSSISFYAYDPIQERCKKFPPIILDNRDKYITQALHLKNRQEQFLLAEAYENLEKYLKNILEVEAKSTIDIIKKAKSNISGLREKSKEGINYDFRITLIEKLRHIIVHNNGFTENKKDFIQKVLDGSGISNNSKPNQEYVDFVNKFFYTKDNKHIVMLSPVSESIISCDIFHILLENIASYAMIVNYKAKQLKQKKIQ